MSLARVVLGDPGAPTLVLLHGVTASALAQAGAIEHWAGLGYRVVAVDARGHGISPRWTPAQLERAGDVLVDDAIAVLEDLALEARGREALGLPVAGTPVVVGHSMGAATAMVAAGTRPDLVRGVVLEDPARYGSRTEGELAERGREREESRRTVADDLPGALARTIAEHRMPHVEEAVNVWAVERSDPAHLLSGVVTPPVPWEEGMAALAVPTLLVTGDESAGARVGHEGSAVLERIGNPHVEVVLLPGAGHTVRRDRPDGFHGAVDPWLAKVLGPSGTDARAN